MRRIVALVIAAVFLVAVQPGAMAMPAVPAQSSTMMADCGSPIAEKCDHSTPMQKQNSPCKDMANCLGMLNCFAPAVITANNKLLLPAAVIKPAAWPLQQFGHGLTQQPDNPPPIV